jgi:signal transduction histidine kinase
MRVLSSLRSRIFLTSALLAVLSIGIALYVVNQRVTAAGEAALRHDIVVTATLVDELRKARMDTFMTMARFIADTSQLKAAVDTKDPLTVQKATDDIYAGYQKQLNSKFLIVTDQWERVLATIGTSGRVAQIIADQPAVRDALAGQQGGGLLPQPDGVLQLVTVPIALGRTDPEILGSLSVGFLLDDAFAAQLKTITGSEIAFGMDGQILASTLPHADRAALSELLRRSGDARSAHIGSDDYVALTRPLPSAADSTAPDAGPVALILRSRTEQLRPLQAIHRALGVTAVVAVLMATLLSFAVARTITRPLAAITDAMREVATTGDLTRKISLGRRRWDDEDARLLATTFNTLTDSIARFQREISQKERLSSLGRLSTVIAHEVRNPLMIIKASLHTLRRPDASPAVREAVSDIDEEVERLNRVVNEVLDFARPIQFELAPADLNALCRESAAAAEAGPPGPSVHLDLDGSLPPVTVDAERLRIALVNMLVNARHAVNGRPAPDVAPRALVTLTTRARDRRVAIVIADRGVGIHPSDLPRVFDPYFTSRRGGTGLGLPIAKNIVEGLGGTIAVTSAPGVGTEIRIEFPIATAGDGDGDARATADHAPPLH